MVFLSGVPFVRLTVVVGLFKLLGFAVIVVCVAAVIAPLFARFTSAISKWLASRREGQTCLLAALVAIFLSVSCGGGGSGTTQSLPRPPPPSIMSVSVTCSPTTIESGHTSQCTATVQGTGNFNASVTWTPRSGTISTSGLYTAPAVTATTQVTVTVTSVQDTTKSGTAAITVNPVPNPPSTITSVKVTCAPATLQTGQTTTCSAAVTGTGNYSSAVLWLVDHGTIDQNGNYPAPATATTATVQATSVQDSTKSGTATIVVNAVVTGPAFIAIPDINVSGLGQKITPVDLSHYVQGGTAPFTFALVTQTSSDSVVASINGTQLVSDYGYHPGMNSVTVSVTDANQKSAQTTVNIVVTIPTVAY